MPTLRSFIFNTCYSFHLHLLLNRIQVANKQVAILTFHRVDNDYDPNWPSLSIEKFRCILQGLAKYVHFARISELEHLVTSSSKPIVCITFDDGYHDFITNALPVLEDLGVPSLHNICPGLIDKNQLPWPQVLSSYILSHPGQLLRLPSKEEFVLPSTSSERFFLKILSSVYLLSHDDRIDFISSLETQSSSRHGRQLMTWDQVRECRDRGVDIGSHSMNHYLLSLIQDIPTIYSEIADSRQRIYEELGVPPEVFAFPSGFYSDQTLNLVKECGFRYSLVCSDLFTSHKDILTSSSLPRINIGSMSFPEELLRASGFHLLVKSFRHTMSTHLS
jgi:peptidoglycan/xylan/chitin deacetylase (PgdA/CDA1 family)